MIRIGGIDLETTGLSQSSGHRIVEVGFSMFKTLDGVNITKVGETLCRRINPERSIDEKAYQVHGISSAELIHCDKWEAFAPKLCKLFNHCDIIIAHNADFDIPFVGGEFARVGLDPGDPLIFCTMREGKKATPMGSVPSLGKLCWALGVEYDSSSAHNAGYDIDRTMDCFLAGLTSGLYQIDALEKLKSLRSA